MSDRRSFVLLDRDGTIIRDRHYLDDPAQVELLPGALEGLAILKRLGLGLVVVTNQSGLARGYFDEPRLRAVHARLIEVLARGGIELDGIYHCPHGPDEGCSCRKPRTGLLERAAEELGIDLEASFVIGDKPCDVELGRAVGACSFLVRTGYGATYADDETLQADHVVDDLEEAARVIERRLTS